MGILEMFLLGVSLSMDAFAISICRGLNMRRINYRHTVVIAFFFGGAQGLMPLLGWLLGSQFASYIESFDHWVAFGLLAFIGGKMIWEVLRGEEEIEVVGEERLDLKELTVMAVATSIDALAVGIALAIERANISLAAVIIGVTTFAICFFGVMIGNRFGARFKEKAELAGGIALILIGLHILLQDLGVY